jgi:hypothetical protein
MPTTDDVTTEPEGKNRTGRPTICTNEVIAGFVELIEAGNYFEPTAILVGISKQDAYNWLKWGSEGKDAPPPDLDAYRNFFDSVTRAEAKAEADVVALVKQAGQAQEVAYTEKGFAFAVIHTEDGEVKLPGDLRANLEFLARRYRDRWSPTQNTRTGQDPTAGPTQVEHGGTIALDGLRQLLSGYAAGATPGTDEGEVAEEPDA